MEHPAEDLVGEDHVVEDHVVEDPMDGSGVDAPEVQSLEAEVRVVEALVVELVVAVEDGEEVPVEEGACDEDDVAGGVEHVLEAVRVVEGLPHMETGKQHMQPTHHGVGSSLGRTGSLDSRVEVLVLDLVEVDGLAHAVVGGLACEDSDKHSQGVEHRRQEPHHLVASMAHWLGSDPGPLRVSSHVLVTMELTHRSRCFCQLSPALGFLWLFFSCLFLLCPFHPFWSVFSFCLSFWLVSANESHPNQTIGSVSEAFSGQALQNMRTPTS